MTLEALGFIILIALHLHWAYKEKGAERERDDIRRNLIRTLEKIIDAQNEFRPLVGKIIAYIERVERT